MVKGHAIRNPTLLNQFSLLSFADLKTYKFVYWYAQPALSLVSTVTGSVQRPSSETQSFSQEVLHTAYKFLARLVQEGQDVPPVFAVVDTRLGSSDQFSGEDASTRPVPSFGFEQSGSSNVSATESANMANTSTNDGNKSGLEAMTLFDAWLYRNDPNLIFVTLDDAAHPQALGWSTRNFLTLLTLYSSLDRSAYFLSSLFVSDNYAQREQEHRQGQEQLPPTDRKPVQLLALRNPLLRKLFQQHANSSAANPSSSGTSWDIAKLGALLWFLRYVALLCSLFSLKFHSRKYAGSQRHLLPAYCPCSRNFSVLLKRIRCLHVFRVLSYVVAQDASVQASISLPIFTLPVSIDQGGEVNLPILHEALCSAAVGWEPNERGKAGPRVVDMKATLDARLLMSQAVDLNLRLMKWRMWPTLQVDVLAQQRCLLLGSGTLGCAVARSLMAWGVKQLTLVDNGRVSYSNPARQCLFDFQDCQQGRYKAIAASDQLQRIYPGMKTSWQLLSIPMPGHPYTTSNASAGSNTAPSSSAEMEAAQAHADQLLSSETAASTNKIEPRVLLDEEARARLDELVRTHDVIFLLTDSREARWLPTMLAQTHNKLAINAALGFDSYLVMHQGIPASDASSTAPAPVESIMEGEEASGDIKAEARSGGCYFCSDIVAAANSQKDRTLDEQCTVTRPGLALIAGALCGEMLVAIVHEAAQRTERARKQEQRRLRLLTKQLQQHQIKTPLPADSSAATAVAATTGGNEIDEYHLGSSSIREGGEGMEEEEEEILAAQYSVEVVPHQVRGSVLGFSQMLLEVRT